MDDLVKDAREAFESGIEADRANRAEALQDLKFLAGEQWPEVIRAYRAGRPTLTFNRLPQYERQITGDMRLNPPGINVRPVDSGADPATAKTYTGLIRNIESQSNGIDAYLTAATNAVRCGEGWFGLTYDYVEDSFDMELGFRRIPSPLAVVCDPAATDTARGDAQWLFVSDLYPLATFRAMYPKASLAGWEDPHQWEQWRQGDYIRVAEYWRKVPVKRTLLLLTNGAVLDATDLEEQTIRDAVNAAGGLQNKRTADSFKVEMHKLSGLEQLEECHYWPGRHIPIVRVAGDEINIGDRIVRYGIVRFAREPQQLYNIQRTAMAEAIGMAPKAKWIGTAKQFGGLEDRWARANISNDAFLTYNSDPTAPGPPQRIASEMPAAGLLQDAQIASADIEATIGIYRESLGRESNAISGKAIISRQREGDVGTYIYMDNLAKAVTQAGRILIDVLPKVYDTPRQVRILSEDGKEEFVPINMTDPNTGQKLNDLSAGRYDVVSSVGPSFSTRREEARESMMTFVQAVPAAAQMSADLIAEAMDWPGAEGIAQRLRKAAVAAGYAEPKEGEPPAPQSPPNPQMMAAQAQMALAQAEQMKAQAAAMKVQSDAEMRAAEIQLEGQKIELQMMELQVDAGSKGAKARNDAANTRIKAVSAATSAALSVHKSMQPAPVMAPGVAPMPQRF